ncbi:MAG: hypothetical protein JNK82_39635 [Myxococcaceae bacterium]|nr:hypothetical protein [Myxococcaceae bacterium]
MMVSARSQTETAFGGMMLGMAMPLAAFGFGVVVDTADWFGLRDEPLVMPFGALIFLGAVLLGTAGGTLLWSRRVEPVVRAARRPVLHRARRREVPVLVKVHTKAKAQPKPRRSGVLVPVPSRSLPSPYRAESYSDQSLVTLTPLLGPDPRAAARDAMPTSPLKLGTAPDPTTRLVAFTGTNRRIRIVS